MEHISSFGLSFDSKEEFLFRQGIFEKNDISIKQINARENSFEVAHNKFSTWTSEEFLRLAGYREDLDTEKVFTQLDITDIPESIDWRDSGVINEI